jgi:threonine dehydratase
MHTASFEGVRDAARQILGHAVRTPLIEAPPSMNGWAAAFC